MRIGEVLPCPTCKDKPKELADICGDCGGTGEIEIKENDWIEFNKEYIWTTLDTKNNV